MRRGVRLGIDVGKARVGVARSDADGMLAMPVETIVRGTELSELVSRIVTLVGEFDATEVVVGLPLSMRGTDTPSTEDARLVAAAVAAHIPTRLVDERLSTVMASQGMRASGKRSKQQRSAIDQAAAVVILQHALDTERATGAVPGTLAAPEE